MPAAGEEGEEEVPGAAARGGRGGARTRPLFARRCGGADARARGDARRSSPRAGRGGGTRGRGAERRGASRLGSTISRRAPRVVAAFETRVPGAKGGLGGFLAGEGSHRHALARPRVVAPDVVRAPLRAVVRPDVRGRDRRACHRARRRREGARPKLGTRTRGGESFEKSKNRRVREFSMHWLAPRPSRPAGSSPSRPLLLHSGPEPMPRAFAASHLRRRVAPAPSRGSACARARPGGAPRVPIARVPSWSFARAPSLLPRAVRVRARRPRGRTAPRRERPERRRARGDARGVEPRVPPGRARPPRGLLQETRGVEPRGSRRAARRPEPEKNRSPAREKIDPRSARAVPS